MKKLFTLLLIAAALSAQTKKPPQSVPNMNIVPANIIAGVAEMPKTKLQAVWTAMTGKLVWKHFHRDFVLAGIGNHNPICWIENMTHPLPGYLDHDPRNVVLTRSSIDFDAVAGDSIAYKVGFR